MHWQVLFNVAIACTFFMTCLVFIRYLGKKYNNYFMKRILVLFFSAGILLGCNSNVANHEEASTHANDTFQVEAQKNKELSLNNEIKWNSDESTNKNVKELKTINDNFNQKKETEISGYKTLATNLQ